MTIKRKGNITKERILYFAKKEFYQNGYNKTQLKRIAEQAELSLGNLNYYFKKKDDLVKEIYNQFFIEVYQFIEDQHVRDALQQHCCFLYIIYNIVLTDENNKRFYYEIIQNKSNYRVMQELMHAKYQDIVESLQLSLSDLEFEFIILTEFGARREIFLNYFTGHLPLTIDALIYYLIKNTCKKLDVSGEAFEALIARSHEFIAQKDFSQLKFLV
ncbi:TetR/AcrR family transcriptional regulator [Eubacterium sp. 1001713B170207_170306_E7]|uniref:TetR/AcrR family transcriptional regulator n=1 Tax=Eubacterium sp. 1001713B170207_170306_E7 TaxID=2787097 RepID=UPI00189B5EB9|nr:TetR/AcrR family transcriptional regulator [Eubacterium sp. 1001713B170207_170306_E7]